MFDIRSKVSDHPTMTGSEFIRRLTILGRRSEVPVKLVARRGKGSHVTRFYGSRFTVVRNRKNEIKKETLSAMLARLDLRIDEL